MAGNVGIAPPELTTDVGQFRAMVGDLAWEPLDPPQPGFGVYRMFSDAEIEAYLAQSEDSVSRAIGYGYLYLAGQAAMEARQVKDYDLQVDTTKRAADLRAIAQSWFDRANEEDALGGLNDIFETFDMVGSCGRCELSEGVYCCGRC